MSSTSYFFIGIASLLMSITLICYHFIYQSILIYFFIIIYSLKLFLFILFTVQILLSFFRSPDIFELILKFAIYVWFLIISISAAISHFIDFYILIKSKLFIN